MATQYVVLKKTDESVDFLWEEIGSQEAANDLAAIKALLEASDGKYGAGTYRAVPKRSWPDTAHVLKPQVRFV